LLEFLVDLLDDIGQRSFDTLDKLIGEFVGERTGSNRPIRKIAVLRVVVEELRLVFEGNVNWHFIDDVLLSAVDDTDVTQPQWDLFVHQHLLGAGALVHDIDLGDHTDCALTVGVPLPC
jgi:hypothetical protein